jgi:pantetheine-phosphate adenylyltransferase
MKAVYPGTFDPITSGHLDIIVRASDIYEQLIVVVAVNGSKAPLFGTEERVAMLEKTVRTTGRNNVTVACFSSGLLVDYTENLGAGVIVRGLRAVSDFEYEFQMAQLNRHLKPSIETVFMMTSAEHLFLSSSIVKEIARLRGDISSLVPEAVLNDIQTKFAAVSADAPLLRED